MNEAQRQLLADRLDEVARRLIDIEEDIERLNRQLTNKTARLNELLAEQKSLGEGIDW